jgi:hypothetical protein
MVAALPDFAGVAIENDDDMLVISKACSRLILRRRSALHLLPEPSSVECPDARIAARTFRTGRRSFVLIATSKNAGERE